MGSLTVKFVLFLDADKSLTALVITLSVVGKMCFTVSYGAIYVQTPEMYPTSIRNTGFGICGAFAKIATLISPYFRVLVSNSTMYQVVIKFDITSIMQ